MKATSIIFISILVVVVFGFALPQTTYAFHWFFSPPSTDVVCGDVLEPSKKFKLVQDLNCTESPALTLRSGTVLDMNGHTVMCSGGMEDVTALGDLGATLDELEAIGEQARNGELTVEELLALAEEIKSMAGEIEAMSDEVSSNTVTSNSIGILLDGRGGVLKNGTVTGCEAGVSVAGSGFNLVKLPHHRWGLLLKKL